MTAIYNFKKGFDRQIELVQESKILKVNKDHILEFKDYLLSENIGYAKITKYMQDVSKLARMLNKPFKDAKEQDIRRIVSEINQANLSPHTKKGFKAVIRRFYCFIRGIKKKGVYPPEVEWISIAIPPNQNKLPEELLTDEEIKSIVREL